MSKKEKFALYLAPEKKTEIEKRYHEDGSRSLTQFICHAIDFYLDHLSIDSAGDLLPKAIQSYIDGRLGAFENRISSLLFKQAVEIDMAMRIIADCVSLDEEYMRKCRGKSVSDVKRTNGQLRFENIARESEE